MYSTWSSQELCAMWRQRVRDRLSLLHPSQWGLTPILQSSRLVPTFTARTEKAGATGGNCQLYRLLALQPQGVKPAPDLDGGWTGAQAWWEAPCVDRVPNL